MDAVAGELWTEAELDYLRTRYVAGDVICSIALALKRSEPAVREKIIRLKFRRNSKFTDAQREYVREHYSTKMPVVEIADATGLEIEQVGDIARRMGIRRPLQLRASRMHADILREYVRDGPKGIAERFGVTRGHVNRIARSLGLRRGPAESPHIHLRATLADELMRESAAKVAARHGMTKGQVMGQVHRYRRSLRNARAASEARR